MQGMIIDNFAGGGGASTGIEAALGRPVDVAINHDPQAVAMHRANHPGTLHYCQSVWRADPLEVTKGRPVTLAWFSPDCKHFSKAKGGKPVEKNIRDLAWVVALWAKRVRPAVIMLENVEEFKTWGPLTEDGMPCPDRKGHTFRMWRREFTRRGYKFEMRELAACDYGDEVLDPAPTIRKRLFIIMRCDGLPIVWPERTHGPADHPDVIAGRLKPWRVAADCIDWSLPCPSIFDSSETIKALYGLRAQRPLADATLRRVARGVMKYVVSAARPFIVPTNTNNVPSSIDSPLPTVTTGGRNILVAPSLVQTGYGEREGQAPRSLDINAPIGTQVAGGGKHALVASFLAQHNTGVVGHGADEPVSTLTSKPGPQGVVAVHMTYAQQGGLNRPADAPMHTLTASAKDQNAMVAANLIAVNHGDSGGSREYSLERPANTQTQRRGEALVAASMLNLRGADRRDASIGAPLRTVSAGGNHAAVVGAFLAKYYGAGDPSQGCGEPMHTVTAKPRHGLVTVQVDGETFAIADIGMRMLTPRERFRAQGFPDSYVIDHGIDENGERVKLSLDAQGRMCGNSVCPPLAAALVRANVAAAEQAVAA
jgi:DNA (cytosine-5)-methyltransferase 1